MGVILSVLAPIIGAEAAEVAATPIVVAISSVIAAIIKGKVDGEPIPNPTSEPPAALFDTIKFAVVTLSVAGVIAVIAKCVRDVIVKKTY